MAIDDGSFSRTARSAPIVAVVVSLPGYVEAVSRGSVQVDGTDATTAILELIDATGQREGLRTVLLDGIAVGGFNLIDLTEIHERTGLPVISVTKRKPDFDGIRAALKKYFPRDFACRWRLVRGHRLYRHPTRAGTVWVAAAGVNRQWAMRLVDRTLVRGSWPEPLRLAHLIARAVARPSRPARLSTLAHRGRG